ncbi:MAG: short-chain dehydrogenase, partial [Alphaproteobacteria bacterium]|nr:short-chain dehydrogenase [Alphaproteobacteria bacterium]
MTGPILVQRAFRALFLAAGLHAVVAMAAWLLWLGLQFFAAGAAPP